MAQKLGQIPTEFPSQAVSDAVKKSQEYGLSVARAIEQEWFNKDNSIGRFWQTRDEYNKLRLYARGEQSIRKYKDEFATNGDLSYLNLDWKPVPIIPKFVDIIVNGMQDRLFSIKAFAQDPIATGKRTKFVENIQRDLHAKEILADLSRVFAGTGLTATNSVIAVDSSQAITALTGGDLTIYEDANNADVSLKLGTSATESLSIEVLNGSSNKTAEEIHFSTATASSTANHGKMVFDIDGTDQMEINDSGVSITGDLTITGDDLFMNTNTAGHILVGDDTNYNPVAVSGDVTLASSGAVTIANDAVESGMLNDNVISGQTEISSGLADADELLYSDGGTLKKVGLDTLTTHINSTAASKGFATAMAIAL